MRVTTTMVRVLTNRLSLLALLGIILFINACKKTADPGDELTGSQQVTIAATPAGNPAGRMTAREKSHLLQRFTRPQANVSNISILPAFPAEATKPGPGCCIDYTETFCSLYDVDYTNCSTQNTVRVTYRWTVYERRCLAGTISYDFSVALGLGDYPGTATLVDSYPFVVNYVCCFPPEYYTAKIFHVTVDVPANQFAIVLQTVNTLTGTSSCLDAPHVTELEVPLEIYYCDYPARVYVTNSGSGIIVSTECGAACAMPAHTDCPSGSPLGTFEYRVLGSSSGWTSVNLTSQSTTISPIPPNNPGEDYEFRATLNYSGCSTLEGVGKFHI